MNEDIEIQSELHRLNGLRFCGVWQTEHGEFALFEDALERDPPLCPKTGETLGEGVERVTARYRQTDSDIAPSIL